jgi:NAD dependent epimerase/dehydratase family enzyme
MAQEMMFASQRAMPERAKGTGYGFCHPTLEQALEAALAKP